MTREKKGLLAKMFGGAGKEEELPWRVILKGVPDQRSQDAIVRILTERLNTSMDDAMKILDAVPIILFENLSSRESEQMKLTLNSLGVRTAISDDPAELKGLPKVTWPRKITAQDLGVADASQQGFPPAPPPQAPPPLPPQPPQPARSSFAPPPAAPAPPPRNVPYPLPVPGSLPFPPPPPPIYQAPSAPFPPAPPMAPAPVYSPPPPPPSSNFPTPVTFIQPPAVPEPVPPAPVEEIPPAEPFLPEPPVFETPFSSPSGKPPVEETSTLKPLPPPMPETLSRSSPLKRVDFDEIQARVRDLEEMKVWFERQAGHLDQAIQALRKFLS